MPRALPGLSKSRYVAGLQCEKLLWWRVHEPDAPELAGDDGRERVLARGRHVGEVARSYVPGGVLVDPPHAHVRQRVEDTAKAIAGGARAVYEASFQADGVFVSVDILERRGREFVLVEVKSTLDVKEEHLPDVAIQLHVVRRAGLSVRRAEVIHLNRECRHPDLSNLFLRTPVTAQLPKLLAEAPVRIAALRSMLGRPVPEVATGPHCEAPYECAFRERCWPPLPEHHLSTVYRLGAKRLEALLASGLTTIHDVAVDDLTSEIARRQVRSVQSGRVVVEPGLARALAVLRPPLAYLDFETIGPAIPVWPGCTPYEHVPVQLSCHGIGRDGAVKAYGWLAEPGADPRRALAEALLDACAKAKTIVAYNAAFESRCIDRLAAACPDLARDLVRVQEKLVDLLPIVRDHVYHPDFGGSFGLKSVVPALCPELAYDDLEIQDGDTASATLEALLLAPEQFTDDVRAALRRSLLAYCERDTLALVRLHERLGELAGTRSKKRARRT